MEGVLSVWGSLGRPQALLGGAPAPAPAAAAAPGPSPAPPLDASSQATAGSPAGARAQHSHTHTHTKQNDEQGYREERGVVAVVVAHVSGCSLPKLLGLRLRDDIG